VYLWRVAVAAPTPEVRNTRTLRDFGDPEIKDTRLAQGCKIANHVHGDGHQQEQKNHPETGHQIGQNQKGNRCHHHIDDEEIHRHARKHLWAGERAVDWMADKISQRIRPLPRRR